MLCPHSFLLLLFWIWNSNRKYVTGNKTRATILGSDARLSWEWRSLGFNVHLMTKGQGHRTYKKFSMELLSAKRQSGAVAPLKS